MPVPHSRRLRVAVIGAGAIGPLHAASYAANSNAELVGVVDVVPARAAELAASYGSTAYSSVDELLAHTNPELVSIATPPGTHADLAIQLLRADRSVVLEKPPVLSLAQMDQLEKAERESAGDVSAIFQHRFGSGAQRAHRLLDKGALGSVYFALCETSWFRPRSYFDPEWRGTWDGEGGGPTLGHGIHQIDLMLYLLGPWRSVDAHAFRLDRHVEFEDVSLATVVFESGAVGTVINSLVSPRELSRIRIDTSSGSLELNHLYGYSDHDWSFVPAPGPLGPHSITPGAPSESSGARDDRGVWDATADIDTPSSHEAQLSRLVDDTLAERKHEATLQSSRSTMEFVTAVYASSFTRKRVYRADLQPGHPFYDHLDGHTRQSEIDKIVTPQ